MAGIASYELGAKLGTGGMGTVYRARDARTDRVVALKVLHPHLAGDPDYVARLSREAGIARNLDHPNIVRVVDEGRDGDQYYIAMELVEGETLLERLKREKKLPGSEARQVALAVALALGAAHKRGVVHRDIKPGNILLGTGGAIKVSDFGIARATGSATLTQTGLFMGTVAYAAPEAIDKGADIRSDLYSLGIVLYQMLTGNVPFEADTPLGVLRKHERETPDLARVERIAPSLAAIVRRLLEKDPTNRFEDPAALVAVLLEPEERPRVVPSGSGTDQPPPRRKMPAPSTGGAGGRRRFYLAAGGAIAVLVLGITALVGAVSGINNESVPTPTTTPTETPTRTPTKTPTRTQTPTRTPTNTRVPIPTDTPTNTPDPFVRSTIVVQNVNRRPYLGAWTTDVLYDRDGLVAVSCSAEQGGVCNERFSDWSVRIVGASARGVGPGNVEIGTITYRCQRPGSYRFTIDIVLLADATVGYPQAMNNNVTASSVVCP